MCQSQTWYVILDKDIDKRYLIFYKSENKLFEVNEDGVASEAVKDELIVRQKDDLMVIQFC